MSNDAQPVDAFEDALAALERLRGRVDTWTAESITRSVVRLHAARFPPTTDETLEKALPPIRICEQTVGAIEAAVIEATGNGEFAAFLARFLLDYAENRERIRTLYAAAEAHGWDRAHEPAKCGHARANYKDPKYGTSKYAGEEECEFCAALAALQQHPPGCYSREEVDKLLTRQAARTLFRGDARTQQYPTPERKRLYAESDAEAVRNIVKATWAEHDSEQEEGKP